MIKLSQLARAVRLLRKGHLGDGAILKADALGVAATPDATARLEGVRGYLPPIDLQALAALPEGSFGQAYARHMLEHGLRPFQVSPELDRAILRRNVFAARYAVTHDMFHLLLGFDTTLPGEMGVLAFAAAQSYSRSQGLGLPFALVLYAVLAPRQIGRTWRALRQGWRLGKQAQFLLGERFEESWHRPLTEVRRSLGLPEVPGRCDPPVAGTPARVAAAFAEPPLAAPAPGAGQLVDGVPE